MRLAALGHDGIRRPCQLLRRSRSGPEPASAHAGGRGTRTPAPTFLALAGQASVPRLLGQPRPHRAGLTVVDAVDGAEFEAKDGELAKHVRRQMAGRSC